MFVNFGSGKCPICGDFGRTMTRNVFHCTKCRISFNDFYVSSLGEMKGYENKYWN